MRLYEDAVVPRVFVAGIGVRFVFKFEISDDLCVGRIRGADGGLAMHKFVGLVEIGSLCHVDWDNCVVLVKLRDAVYLNC